MPPVTRNEPRYERLPSASGASPGAKTSGAGNAFVLAASFSLRPGPSCCLPAGSLCVLPEPSRTVNGEREEMVTLFAAPARSTRTRLTGASPRLVPG